MRISSRHSRSLVTLATIAALVISSVGVASATDTGVSGGSLSGPSVSNLSLAAVGVINLGTAQTALGSETVSINDDRGDGSGWRVSVAATNFTATVADPTVEAATLLVTLPVNEVLNARVTDLASTQGQGTDGLTQTTVAAPVTTGGLNLLSAAVGYGMGYYTSTYEYTFTLPKTVAAANVVSSDIATSVYKPDHAVTSGIWAATYATTLTYTTSTSP